MSLQPQEIPPVPETTATTARAAFPHGNRYIAMRDELGSIYTDQQFAALFPTRGQPAVAPWRLALVLVFQFAESLSDAQAIEAVRARIDWKYALSLELTDSAFDPSVLSEFRDRLIAGSHELHILDTMLARFKALGLLVARGRQRTDSTHVLAAVRALNHLQIVGETLRHTLNVLAVTAPDWLTPRLHPDWRERYGSRLDESRLPKTNDARQALAEQIGADGRGVLEEIYAPTAPAWLRALPAVQTLRCVWMQQFHAVAVETPMRWRASDALPPGSQIINSPYDTDARYGHKRSTEWTGYKVHLTESCDTDAPHFITHVVTSIAPGPDYAALEPLHAALAAKELLPAEHLVDAGYPDADALVTSQQQGIDLIGPVTTNQHWQQRAQEGYDIASFALDWDAKIAHCPAGQTSRKWSATHDTRGNAIINIRFDRAVCAVCPSRSQCTRSAHGARELTVRPQAQHQALQAARKRCTTAEFRKQYAARAGIEGTISEGVRVSDLRRSRYVGRAKTHLHHILSATAINLRRFGAWVSDIPRAQTRTPAFVKLMVNIA